MIQRPQQDLTSQPDNGGFTIVELLVVIVVIGILAAITIVAYSGISQKAVASSLLSDLTNSAQQLKMYYTDHGTYPTSLDGNNCPLGSAPSPDTKYCLKASSGNTLVYSSIVPSTFHLTNTNVNKSFAITDATAPTVATTTNGSTVGSACPSGFIPVPGSGTYGTNDFCTMKYNAKADDNSDGTGDTNQTTGSNTWPADTYQISASRKLVSTAAGYPVANISQTTAITAASTYTNNCPSGCHLITEAEYLTIAQNVLTVASNWDNGAGAHTVGTGYIYSGHNDNAPGNALAVTNTNDGYSDTGNSAPSNQRRTLTLSNGEVIWDLAGNVLEWTSGTSTTGQPGVAGAGYNWREWTSVTNPGTISPNPSASATGISGASGWNSGNGIGQIYSSADETGLRGFIRGGGWGTGGTAGVLRLGLDNVPSNTDVFLGFRVTR